ncbi:hypothetical protein [Pseudoalteromonas tunicata]|jgi:hypothetical protein|uniref:Uncharacterized protein n=1 Tax=Pseudoalteromonas tunicata D2 TaxID=87626 RepID=A4CBT5_9GAMM|nr:hypothetical protein [Pseudoalteromonas tunicata]ATC94377.1 hypothetical protein PTUN_a1795 [Pseudoalteromonas tunicata]EAR27822.1 hypothetical protein PTD2_18410 [Pseudoalteromonas tunicata D2]MDP5211596.1 hypothetical protein [Pseudoalteromonas tunicata]
MLSQSYCRALEVRIFNKSKEIRRLKSQLFFFRLVSLAFVGLFIVSQLHAAS